MRNLWHLSRQQLMLRALVTICALGGLMATGIALTIAYYMNRYAQELPSAADVLSQLSDDNLPLSTEVFDRQGRKIGEFVHEQRYYIGINKMPKFLLDAFLSAEDKDFYNHPGYSVLGIVRAAIANLRRQRVSQGASTITQQVARIYFLSNAKTFERKLKEIMLAIKIEKNLSKQQILELYLNKIYLGNRSYGVEAAARNYFGKSVDKLTLGEASLLAGLPQAPSRLDPSKNLAGALQRRDIVLALMVENRLISSFERDQALIHPLHIEGKSRAFSTKAPYFIEMVKQEFERKFEHWRPKTTGLKIYTSLDAAYQKESTAVFTRALQALRDRAPSANPTLAEPADEEIQGAMVAVDPVSGGILAVQGGSGFQQTQFNRALLTERPVAGNILPIIAAAAFENGYTPTSLVNSDPYHIEEAKVLREDTLHKMLTGMDTELGFQLYMRLGASNVNRVAKRCGLAFDADNLMVGMGMGESSPLRLASCYGALANKGRRAPTFVITEIQSREGEVLYKKPAAGMIPVMAEASSFMLAHLLRDLYRLSIEQESDVQSMLNQSASLTHMGALADVTDDLQSLWGATVTPEVSLVYWFGAEHGKMRATATKADGRRFVQKVLTATVKSLPAIQKTFTVPEGISYQRVPLSLSDKKMLTIPRFDSGPTRL